MRRRSIALVSAAVKALEQVDGWSAENVAAGVVARGEVVATRGPGDQEFRWASVTKPATSLAVLVAAEEGTVDLDESAGPPLRPAVRGARADRPAGGAPDLLERGVRHAGRARSRAGGDGVRGVPATVCARAAWHGRRATGVGGFASLR